MVSRLASLAFPTPSLSSLSHHYPPSTTLPLPPLTSLYYPPSPTTALHLLSSLSAILPLTPLTSPITTLPNHNHTHSLHVWTPLPYTHVNLPPYTCVQRVLQHDEESALLKAYITEWTKYFTQCNYLPLPFQAMEMESSNQKPKKRNQEGNRVQLVSSRIMIVPSHHSPLSSLSPLPPTPSPLSLSPHSLPLSPFLPPSLSLLPS